jgi:replicative DNA helicase
MPIKPNSESKLISALINTQDVAAASMYGVTPEMFLGFQTEYRWMTDYPKTYDSQPSVESLLTKFPDFPHSEAYIDVAFICDEVKDKHNHRTMVQALHGAGEALRNGDTDEAYAFFSSVQHPTHSMSIKLKNALHDLTFLDTYGMEEVEKIHMPWKTLQRVTGGIAPGDLWYLAARLGQGKSWSLACIIKDALLAGKRVAMFSLEMPERQVATRIHSGLAMELGIKVTHSDLHGRTYDPIAYRKLMGAIKEQVPGELFIVDTSKGSISTAHVAALTKSMDLATIDYAGLLSSPMGTRAIDDWRNMAMISNILKEVAVVNDVPIISAAQINREGDTSGWKPPKVKNLAQSDALGQDADVVLTMKKRSKTVAIYSIEKHRHGDSGDLFHTRFLPNEGRFDEISFETARDLIARDTEREEEQ